MNPWNQGGYGQQPPYQGGWQVPGPYSPQPTYPYPPPGAYPPPGTNPWQQPGGGPYPPPPNAGGGTAISAAVLSLLGALANGIGGAWGLISIAIVSQSLSRLNTRIDLPGWLVPFTVINAIVSLALCAALIAGGVQLLRRKVSARILIAVACGVAVVIQLIGIATTVAANDWASDQLSSSGIEADLSGGGYGLGIGVSVLTLAFPIATAVLALLPSTRRWCLAAPQQATGPSPYGGY